MANEHEQFMDLALELAAQGRGRVEPNPMVGAVIVRNGEVIGQGYHRRFGGPHAEVESIAAAVKAGHDPDGAILYVTLEPCCHHGKTPPCTEAIIDAGLACVVTAMEDPDEKVAGKGIARLRAAGVEVITGVRAAEARRLLAAYIKLRRTGRPWVICKWAQSLDGRIATHKRHSKWISDEASRKRVHRLRGICDGVCVGVGTVWDDDPLLTNRSGAGKQPARLVLDESLEIPTSCRLLANTDAGAVIVATTDDASDRIAETLKAGGVEVLRLPAGAGGVDLGALLDELGRREWTYLLVEGGSSVIGSFVRQGLADELMVFVAPCLVGGRRSLGPVDWDDIDSIDQAHRLPPPEIERLDRDVLLRYVLTIWDR